MMVSEKITNDDLELYAKKVKEDIKYGGEGILIRDALKNYPYNNNKYIIELKIWRGEKYHQRGLQQLADYLDINEQNKGYLLIFNFNKDKEYKKEVINNDGKEIIAVFV